MTKNLITLDANAQIREATQILANNNFHSVPILENDALVGLITSTDLLKYYLKAY
jgi:acetoin utilization protein AcuB